MAKKTIKMDLFDAKSLQNAIKQLEQYRDDLPRKAQQLCQRLAEEGVKVADVAINSVPIGRTITLTTDINPSKMGCKAIMRMVGKETYTNDGRIFHTALAIEFGAGIYYNKSNSIIAGKFGMGIGSFPGQTHAYQDGWWYLDDKGELQYSHGVQASMPMYKASVEMQQKVDAIVKEVFG